MRLSGRGTGVAIAVALTMACDGIRSQTHSFGTLDEARAAGAIARGWLPEGLPPGTREIRVAYIPDSARHWGLFDFPPAERDRFEALLVLEEIDLDGWQPRVPSRIEWWPVALRGPLDGEQLAFTGLKAYRTRHGGLVVAVNWNQGRAYYWKTEGPAREGHRR